MFSKYPAEFVINLAAISHIKKLIFVRPQIIRTLIFILASIRVKHVTGGSNATLFSFHPLSFGPSLASNPFNVFALLQF